MHYSLNNLLRWIFYIIEIPIIYVIQESFLIPEILGIRPLILLSLYVSILIFEDTIPCMIFGLILGAIFDISIYGNISWQSVLLCFIGYIIGKNNYKIAINLYSVTLLSIMIIIIFIIIRFFTDYTYSDFKYYVILRHYIPIAIYTICIVPIIYAVNRFIIYHIKQKTGD